MPEREDYRVDVTVRFQADFGLTNYETKGNDQIEDLIQKMFKESMSRAQCVEVTINKVRRI